MRALCVGAYGEMDYMSHVFMSTASTMCPSHVSLSDIFTAKDVMSECIDRRVSVSACFRVSDGSWC